MTAILAEPSLFIYAGDQNGVFSIPSFQVFWNTFDRLRRAMEHNSAQLWLSGDLLLAVQRLFPYSALRGETVSDPMLYAAASVVVKFLERVVRRPVREYEGMEEKAEFEPSWRRRPFVYQDDDVWMSWLDLVIQLVRGEAGGGVKRDDLLAAELENSAIEEADSVVVKVSETGTLVLRVRRVPAADWPSYWVDPDAFASLTAKRGALNVSITYEKSGHQPKPAIKGVLEDTARLHAGIVTRMVTTYHHPAKTGTCRLTMHADISQIKFTISDGEEIVAGYFSSIASDQDEQLAVLRLLERAFYAGCTVRGWKISRKT